MKISAPHTPATNSRYRMAVDRHAFSKAVEALGVGQAVTLTRDDDEDLSSFQSNCGSRARQIGYRQTPRRRYRTTRVDEFSIELSRVE